MRSFPSIRTRLSSQLSIASSSPDFSRCVDTNPPCFLEESRRRKLVAGLDPRIVSCASGEKVVLMLMYGIMISSRERWWLATHKRPPELPRNARAVGLVAAPGSSLRRSSTPARSGR
jgi:hypothetical protein